MASKYSRRNVWWVKFRHPATGEVVRESLETTEEPRAELLRERVELEAALRDPRLGIYPMPQRLGNLFGIGQPAVCPSPIIVPASFEPAPASRCLLDEAVRNYLRYITGENAGAHVSNKLSILRKFLGWKRTEDITQDLFPRKALNGRQTGQDREPCFTGTYLDEITAPVVQNFIESQDVGRSTKRHYREFFHHLFEISLKFELIHATNLHHPNPMSALPSYSTRNRVITFLTDDQVQEQLAVLEKHPALQMAAGIMIFAGLRRAETVWLGRDSVADDFGYLSVLNRVDAESDVENSLKTGARTVTILPKLREMLEKYLPTCGSEWLLPNRQGKRWTPDNFSERLKAVNSAAGLKWTSLIYRHTFATQRATEGWSLHRISKEMGNSPAVVDEYYAGFIRPPAVAA